MGDYANEPLVGSVQGGGGGSAASKWTAKSVILAFVGVACVAAVSIGVYIAIDESSSSGNGGGDKGEPVPIIDESVMDQFLVDPEDYTRYTTGQHRRPTDPATHQEVEAVMQLLFGAGKAVTSLAQADELLANPRGFGALAGMLSTSEMIYPENVHRFSKVPSTQQSFEAEQAFMARYREVGDLAAVHQWARTNEAIRGALRWSYARDVSTLVSNAYKDEIMEAEYAIERGETPEFRRFVRCDFDSGVSDITAEGDVYQSVVVVAIDVTDIDDPFIETALVEVNREYLGNINNNVPDYAPPSLLDAAYFVSFATALYPNNADGLEREYFPYCGTMPMIPLACPTRQWSGDQKFFVQPFRWLDPDAEMYGEYRNETLMSAHLIDYQRSVIPIDAHAIDAGSDIFPNPLSLLYSAFYDMVDPNSGLFGTESIAIAWYGRGLRFNTEAAQRIRDALVYDVEDCPIVPAGFKAKPGYVEYESQSVPGTHAGIPTTMPCVKINRAATDLAVIRAEVADAIWEAWGEDEVFGFQPGVLAIRDSDGATVPKAVIDYPYDKATYINHATPNVVEEAIGMHRDIRDNLPEMRPLVDETTGLPKFVGLGKKLDYTFPDGKSFHVDGYKVVYDVGMKWKFQIGLIEQAGLTIFNIRLQLPPTQAFPEGEEIPYIWKLNIPRFGTTYQNSAYGTLFAANFWESHYTALADVVPGANCRGAYLTLPLFKARQLNADENYMESRPLYYTTYGQPEYIDPFALLLRQEELPFNTYPLDQGVTARNGPITHGVCIQETDIGEGLWHFYSSQRLRMLTVLSSTVSDAYNVVNRFEFHSNGKITVSEHLHGKPAIMGHGIPGAGGAYASAGRGGYGSNHLHWAIVGIEPMLRQTPGDDSVVNKIEVSDLALDHTGNWYGTAYHRAHTTIENTDDEDLMHYNFEKNRYWVMEAVDKDSGRHLGGLRVTSNAFGPPPMRSMYDAPFRYGETDYTEDDTVLINWWLRRNVWVLNEDIVKFATNKAKLIAMPEGPDCKLQGTARRCIPIADEPISDNPIMFVVMKMYHNVITDEVPVQNGFTDVRTEIWPHNLFAFNPNMLIRQQVEYARVFQNPYFLGEQSIYVPPYDTEFEDSPTEAAAKK